MFKRVATGLLFLSTLFIQGLTADAQNYRNGALESYIINSGSSESIPVTLQTGSNVIGNVGQNGTWNINNISGIISLPTGASTSAKQDTIIGHIDTLEALVDGLETITAAIQTSTELLDDTVDTDNTTVPGTLKGLLVAGTDGTNTQVLSVNSDGELGINDGGNSITIDGSLTNISGTISLPTGAATAANQSTEITSLSNIDSDTSNIQTAVELIDDTIDTDNTTVPATLKGQLIAGTDGTNTQVISVNSDGEVGINDGGNSLTVDNGGTFATQATLQAGTAYAAKVRLTDGTTDNTIFDLTNSNPIATQIVDGNGDAITSFGGGTQYTEGDTDTTITGTAILWEDASNTLRVPSSTKPLPVEVIAGATSGTEYTEDDAVASAVGGLGLMRRDDTLGTLTPAEGDVSPFLSNSRGALWVKHDGTMTVDGSGVTQPISAASLPLPTGASTSANQTTIIGHVDGLEGFVDGLETSNSAIQTATELLDDTVDTDNTTVPGTLKGLLVAGTDGTNTQVISVNSDGEVGVNDGGNSLTVDNGGTFVVQENGAALTALQTIDNIVSGSGVNVSQINGVAPSMGNGASGTGVQRVTIANDSTGIVQPVAGTTGGATPYTLTSAASTNATSVKGSAGQLYMATCSNVNAAVRYLKIYNKASAPTVGTDTPILKFACPGNTAGAGSNVPIPEVGLAFGTGIAFALTTGSADSDTGAVGAGDIIVNLGYK